MDEQVSSNRAVNMQGGSVWLHLVDGYLEREGNAAAATATAAAAAALRSSDKVSTRPFFCLFVLRHSGHSEWDVHPWQWLNGSISSPWRFLRDERTCLCVV